MYACPVHKEQKKNALGGFSLYFILWLLMKFFKSV